ncbi:coiled-coil domain-containing protein 78 isoform X3 [Cuculus canorus]|uniref:coiled-coil domain-containing protein 78 isoform X3 n=1 Tax=Cuculus canorus TaxID=55661 RepID=UPI0023AB4BCB|nr:coiled-coil domain-containing protein 78 isoform X3 [Cuculus canorus]
MEKVPGSKTDLSARMVFSEEEKLKISKDLIDLQIETNKMKEQYETENFELKNKILALEDRVLELERCSEKVTGERDALQERLHALESSRKELADEYIILKSNYLALGKELDQEVMKNEELSLELLNLANAKSTFPRTERNHPPAMVNESSTGLEKAQAMVRRLSARMKPEDVVASEHERQMLERNLLGNEDHIKEELEKLKKTYNSQQQKLEERVIAMGKELQEAKGAIGDTQHKLAEQTAVLLTSQSQLREVEVENSQLQLRLKELNEEYRSRLTQYIKDLADYMDSKSSTGTGPSKAPADHAHMKRFVDSMLKDIRASYKSREEQLAAAARGYKKRMKNLVKKHENLLIAYGQLHEESWGEVTKQLRDFARNIQEDLEQERSQLLTRAVVAEEQVSELQEYIEKHLARYKQEILRLRKAAGSEVPRAVSAGVADAHALPRARKTTSHQP